jgi:predicted transposase YdaD
MFTLGDLKQTRVYQDAYREALQVGETRGRQEGELRTILRQLNRKFGTLSPQLVNQISALSIDRLDDLADAVLDLQSLDDLVHWLA